MTVDVEPLRTQLLDAGQRGVTAAEDEVRCAVKVIAAEVNRAYPLAARVELESRDQGGWLVAVSVDGDREMCAAIEGDLSYAASCIEDGFRPASPALHSANGLSIYRAEKLYIDIGEALRVPDIKGQLMSANRPHLLYDHDSGMPISAADHYEPLSAQRAERCRFCKTFIQLGDPIYPIFHGRYGCNTCGHDPELYARNLPPAPKRDSPGYAVKCPRCGSEPRQFCRTPNGTRSPLHLKRKAIAERMTGDEVRAARLASMRGGITVTCPKCAAAPGQYCKTPTNLYAPLHAVRTVDA